MYYREVDMLFIKPPFLIVVKSDNSYKTAPVWNEWTVDNGKNWSSESRLD